MTADNTEKLIEVRDWIRKELDTCVNFWLEHGMDLSLIHISEPTRPY